jgi:hypothetical protein
MNKCLKITQMRLFALLFMMSFASTATPESLENGQTDPIEQPFVLPTLDKPAPPAVDSSVLFDAINGCYAPDGWFRPEISAKVSAGRNSGVSVDDDGSLTSDARKYAGAIVMTIPIYSSSDNKREKEWDRQRRLKTADAVGELISSLAEERRAMRELDLMKSLERRSQKRVAAGVAETAEQVQFLEKVSKLESEIIKQRAEITRSRLSLVAQCPDSETPRIQALIDRYIKAPIK